MNTKPKVGLFVTCLVDLYRPNVGFAAIALLEQSGCEVMVPETQTCCGQPAYNSGDQASTIKIAKQTIDAFSQVDYIVAPSGSCAGMLKHHYPELLTDQPEWSERATEFANRVFELTSFLVEIMKVEKVDDVGKINDVGTINDVGKINSDQSQFDASVTYHDSCSGLRELNIKTQPRKLLSTVNGLSIKEMEDTEVCCGFGGTFCIKFPEISERMVSDKAALASLSGADVLTGGDLGCLMNISGRLNRLASPIRVYHVAEILAGMTTEPAIGEPVDKDRQT